MSAPSMLDNLGAHILKQRTHGALVYWLFYNGEIMPKKVHDALVKQAKKAGLTGARKDAYVYGTLNKLKKK